MELSWSTFVFEIINFLVLVWILKRFLYKPVLEVINSRRAGIEDKLANAQRQHDEAQALHAQYDNRLVEWENERRKASDELVKELAENRANQLANLQTEIAQEREKARLADQHRHDDVILELEHRALQQSAEFATHILSEATGPELEARLLELFLNELDQLTSEQSSVFTTQVGEKLDFINITSAYTLTPQQRQQLEAALTGLTRVVVPARYKLDPELKAGLYITIGAWVLQLNLRDELKGFAEFAHATR